MFLDYPILIDGPVRFSRAQVNSVMHRYPRHLTLALLITELYLQQTNCSVVIDVISLDRTYDSIPHTLLMKNYCIVLLQSFIANSSSIARKSLRHLQQQNLSQQLTKETQKQYT
jgi:hypothetical protein